MFEKIERDLLWEVRATITEISSLRLDQKRIPFKSDRPKEDIPKVQNTNLVQLTL